MHLKNLLPSALAAFFALLIFLISLWRPERQIALHQQHLLDAFANRKWAAAADFLDDGYKDRWGHDKECALRNARIAFAQFLTLEIAGLNPRTSIQAASATVSEKIVLTGDGGEFAQEAVLRVNQLREPFVFTWQRKSWKPWDWRLVRVDNGALEIGSAGDF